jgi:hypothetical protein
MKKLSFAIVLAFVIAFSTSAFAGWKCTNSWGGNYNFNDITNTFTYSGDLFPGGQFVNDSGSISAIVPFSSWSMNFNGTAWDCHVTNLFAGKFMCYGPLGLKVELTCWL